MMIRQFERLGLVGLLSLVSVAAGCRIIPDQALSFPADQVIYHGFSGPPRVRFGSYPSSNIGTFFIGPNLGTHGYCFRLSEKDGIAYTCRGGTIDVIHVRIAADWAAYLTAVTYRHLMDHDSSFSCKLAVDRSRSFITFTYPENWDSLSRTQQMAIAKEIALEVGPYLTFTMTTWHEMLTWYGFKCIGPFPEFPSAFSWEDSYSNLLGTIIGVRALQDSEHEYNEAVKIAIDQEMQKLGIQPADVAKRVTEAMRGKWFTGNIIFHVDMKKRNFDIGLENGYVTPTLIPEVSECPDAQPTPLAIPRLDVLAKYGFSANLEIEPHEWERGKILRIVYGDKLGKRINPDQHFALIMDQIRRDAAAMYGPEYSPDYVTGPKTTHTAQ
jgi:hypothetical protein